MIAITLTIAMPLQALENIAIIGGQSIVITAPAYGALISSPNTVSPLMFSGDLAEFGNITSVSMSSNGNSLIGGQVQMGSNPAYAALISLRQKSHLLLFQDCQAYMESSIVSPSMPLGKEL